MVQWLRLCASNAEDPGSIPGWRTKRSHFSSVQKKKSRLRKKWPTESPAKSCSRGSHRNLSAGPRQIKELGGASSSLPRLASCLVRPLVLEEFWGSFIIRAASILPDLGQSSMLGRRRLYNLGALSLPLSSHTSFVLGVGFSKLVRRAGGTPYR